ncbi:hypothetical protein [Cryobacterium tepidiphilum]|uniref:DNA methylase adenine-specific domain-containing protein n=1 Tax=Cryobacterium tepidiphilum TaxID=2486026 RepID=A0A3M8LPF6_9MICO|nr:hypothetical protein [Cryobacterium tepidiphilum]RNE66742.1 hypothetical protein EEJ31_02865 [Cryobacterium tepidiphilum]
MSEPSLLMTMSDIASLAQVQRPVVSVWRRRAAGTPEPFPAAVVQRAGQELFDSDDVGRWLAASGRGNNPDARADAAAHAALQLSLGGTDAFHALTALVALRGVLGTPLAGLSRDELLDAADERDPDDDMFYGEVKRTDSVALDLLCRYVDALVEAAYNEPAAFEKLIATDERQGGRGHRQTRLAANALQLISQVAAALAATQSGEPVLVDATGCAGDALLAVVESMHGLIEPTVFTAGFDTPACRLLRRRLLVHRIARLDLAVGGDGSFAVDGNVVHVVQYPTHDEPAMSGAKMLASIENIVLQMDDDQLGVVLAPASVLSDGRVAREIDDLRSALLRSGRVRAIVRLPTGLVPRKPQQAQALWVLGAAHSHVDLADRWTMVADLSSIALDEVAIDDLVSDLVASLGDRATVRAHAFRFARLVLTRTLLASRGSLVAGARPSAHSPIASDHAARADALLSALNAATDASAALDLAIEPGPTAATAGAATVDTLLADGSLRYIPGNRIDEADIAEGGTEADGIRLIGPAEVLGDLRLGARRIDRLRYAADYPSGRVTEPGDVVFCTAPRPSAVVDEEGTSVVVFPARILRVHRREPRGLVSRVMAADINALTAADKTWRRWALRRVPAGQACALNDALSAVSKRRQHALERLLRLDELSGLLMDGVASGGFTVASVDPTPPSPERPTKGIA